MAELDAIKERQKEESLDGWMDYSEEVTGR